MKLDGNESEKCISPAGWQAMGLFHTVFFALAMYTLGLHLCIVCNLI